MPAMQPLTHTWCCFAWCLWPAVTVTSRWWCHKQVVWTWRRCWHMLGLAHVIMLGLTRAIMLGLAQAYRLCVYVLCCTHLLWL